jgi:ADP-heptose:LPS heptosyltransferase
VPAGEALDRQLTDFGVTSFDSLYKRAMRTHTRDYRCNLREPPKRIVLLSRVTIGADVAILSVMVQRLTQRFPETDIVVIGSKKLRGLFGGNPGVRVRELHYARRGGLFERFASWHAALEVLHDEVPRDEEHRVLAIDPDSRISQLGVLPMLHTDNYLFFNTRNAGASPDRCMGERTNDWMDSVFGVSEFCHPTVWVPQDVMAKAQVRIQSLRNAGCHRIVAINFGVGQNPRKRVGREFEEHLLKALLAEPETVVLLDRGFGDEEIERTARLIAYSRANGFTCTESSFDDGPGAIAHGVAAMSCDIGEMAALIGHSDEYIGYDSACQHIAAATRTPTITIFAGSNNKSFVRRWSACGRTDCRIVHVNTLTDPAHIDKDEIISRLMQERADRAAAAMPHEIREIRGSRPRQEPLRKSEGRL